MKELTEKEINELKEQEEKEFLDWLDSLRFCYTFK